MGLSEPSSDCSGRVAAARGAAEPSLDAAETVKGRRFHCFCFVAVGKGPAPAHGEVVLFPAILWY